MKKQNIEYKVNTKSGFVLIELLILISVFMFLGSIAFAILSSARLDARDKQRVEHLKQIEKSLNLYINDFFFFPDEAKGSNGDTATNQVFRNLIDQYLSGIPVDPAGIGDPTFFYYYDGSHRCGNRNYAVIFARQMDKPENSNYDEFLNEICEGVLDGEGRGGGTESYNIILGPSLGF